MPGVEDLNATIFEATVAAMDQELDDLATVSNRGSDLTIFCHVEVHVNDGAGSSNIFNFTCSMFEDDLTDMLLIIAQYTAGISAMIAASTYSTITAVYADVTYETNASAGPGASGFQFTFDKTNIDTSLTNFPVLLKLSSSCGKNSFDATEIFDDLGANSLKIQVKTSAGVEMKVEVVYWDATAELAFLRVKVPSITSSSSEYITLSWDSEMADNTTNVGVPGSVAGEAVWDANYIAVLHCEESPVSGPLVDSTSNDNDGTPNNMDGTNLVASQVGKGYDYNGSDEFLQLANEGDFDFAASSFTIEVIFKTDTIAAGNYVLAGKRDSSGDSGYFLREDGTGALTMWVHDGAYKNASTGNSALNAGTTYYGAGTYNAGSNEIHVYLNDTEYGPTSSVGSPSGNNFLFAIARNANGGAMEWFNGVIDEIRISDTRRTAAWLKATYYTDFDNLFTVSNI